jgi:hypothetical protein
MSFAHPFFLWGLLAVPFPLLLHLFFRRRKARIDFSTLQFFHERRRELSMRRRIREWLLLALRTLAVLTLVLALAQPLSNGGFGFAARTQAVIVLDDTLSMDRRLASGGTAFTLACQKAVEVLGTLREGDSAALVFVSGQEGMGFTRQPQRVRARLEAAAVTGAAGSYGAALAKADSLFKAEPAPNRECYILTDLQKNQLPERTFAFDPANCVRVCILGLGGASENLSVAPLKITSRPKTVDSPFAIPYIIRNNGAADRETEARLLLGGATISTVALTVPAGKSVTGVFNVVPDRAGTLNGWVEVADPLLEADNRRYFALDVRDSLSALLVETDPLSRVRPFHFFQAAVDPEPDRRVNGIKASLVFLEELTPKLLDTAAVAVFANPGAIPQPVAVLLQHYLEGGGAAVIFAGPQDGPATCAGFPDPRIAGLFGERRAVETTGCSFQNGLAALNDLVQTDLLRWKALQQFKLPADAVMLATVPVPSQSPAPLIAEIPVGKGRLIVSAASVRRDSGNWPELKSFPIAMIHLLAFATRDSAPVSECECGKPVTFVPDDAAAKNVSIRDAAGEASSVAVEKGEARFTATGRPGFLIAQEAKPRMVALNPAEAESDMDVAAPERLKRLVSATDVAILRTDTELSRQVGTFRRGQDLTGLLLFVAFLSLLAEIWIGAPRKPTV